MFLSGGLGQQPSIAQTRHITKKSPESGWGVATASNVFVIIWIICLWQNQCTFQRAIQSLFLEQSGCFDEPNLYFAYMAPLTIRCQHHSPTAYQSKLEPQNWAVHWHLPSILAILEHLIYEYAHFTTPRFSFTLARLPRNCNQKTYCPQVHPKRQKLCLHTVAPRTYLEQ